MLGDVDKADGEVLLLRRDHLFAIRGEERVVRGRQRPALGAVGGVRELPDDPRPCGVDLDQPVVAFVP